MASERGSAQTVISDSGVVGLCIMEVTNLFGSRTIQERLTIEGDSPVCETEQTSAKLLSTAGHANPAGSWEAHFPRLNTFGNR